MRHLRVLSALLTLALFSPATAWSQPSNANDAAYTRLDRLAAAFFEWRRSQQPVAGDDIPRVERPDGWVPDWSPEAIEEYRAQYASFLAAAEGLDTEGWSVSRQVDARLLRAAIQRVHWELDILRSPHRNSVR